MEQKFLELLNSCKDNNKTNEMFLKYLRKNGFFEAPASARFHLNKEGGLCEHTFNVVEQAEQLLRLDHFNNQVNKEELLFCALVHDVGKIGWNGEKLYIEKFNKDGQRSKTPYEKNKNTLQMNHEDLSLFHVMKFYNLSNDEIFAIKNHNGAYDRNEYNISGKETPLMLALHFSDMIASKIVEKNEKVDVSASFGAF